VPASFPEWPANWEWVLLALGVTCSFIAGLFARQEEQSFRFEFLAYLGFALTFNIKVWPVLIREGWRLVKMTIQLNFEPLDGLDELRDTLLSAIATDVLVTSWAFCAGLLLTNPLFKLAGNVRRRIAAEPLLRGPRAIRSVSSQRFQNTRIVLSAARATMSLLSFRQMLIIIAFVAVILASIVALVRP
jgi:hypothetical protein